MDIRKTLEILNTISEATKETGKGRIHTSEPGGYGRKDDEDAPKKETTRGRGRPKKDADDAGEVKKYDTKSLHSVFGGGEKPKKEVGKTSKKHSLKDWMEHVEANPTLSEGTKEIKGGRRHTAEPGGYGRKDDEDEKGKKVASTVKRGRGRPKKDADADGEVKKYDWSAFGATGKDIKLPKHTGTVTKHKMVGEAEQVTIQPAQQNTQVIKQGNDVLGSVSNPQLAAQIKNAIGKGEMTLAGDDLVNEDSDDLNPVESAIALRITSRHPELIKHGLDNVLDAIREVASNVGDVEEIGTSDVSGWVKQVKDRLSNSQQVSETKVSKYKDLGANQNTTHFIKNMTTGKIVSPHRSRQDAEDALVASTRNSKDEFKIVRAKKSGLTEGDHNSVSFRDMVNVVDRYDSKYYAELSASDISDEEFKKAIVDTYNEIVGTKGLDTVQNYISSGYPDLNEGDDRGNYRATAQAAEAATRAAKTPQEHARAADLHDRAATYALSDGRDESVIYDHQMTAREHRRAAKGVAEGRATYGPITANHKDAAKKAFAAGERDGKAGAEKNKEYMSSALLKTPYLNGYKQGKQGVSEGSLNEGYIVKNGSKYLKGHPAGGGQMTWVTDKAKATVFKSKGEITRAANMRGWSVIPAPQGVAEGLGKSIKRGMAGWGAFDKDKPADVVNRVKGQDTDTLKTLSNRGSTGKGSPAELQQKAIGRELKKRGEQGVSEGQLNEYLTQEGQPLTAILELNLFMDMGPDGVDFMDTVLVKKYKPVASQLARLIRAQKKRKLTSDESDMIDKVWYDGSDAYDDMEVEFLADLYNQQIEVVKDILENQQGMAEGQLDEISAKLAQAVADKRGSNAAIYRAGLAATGVDQDAITKYPPWRKMSYKALKSQQVATQRLNKERGVTEGATPASPSKIFRLIKRQHNDWFDNYGMGEVEDTVMDMHEMGQFDGMSAEDAVVLVGQELESLYGPEGMSESSTGDYSAKKARAGNDIGKPGKNFEKIAKSAGERYGSAEKGKKVAGAVLAKLRTNEGDDNDTPIVEKAVSKNQQKFMGMVHAAQKGEKPASKEVAKVAKTMKKSDVKDFAQTKHKGLPKKVSESINLYEGPSNIEHIVNRFKYEVKQFLNGDELDSDLYNALFDYYADAGEIPYGIAKARTGDPMEWVSARFRTDVKPYVNQTSMATRNISDGMEEGMEIGTTRNTPFSTRPELSQVPAAQRKASGQNFPLTMKQVGDTSNKLSSLDTIRAMKDSSPFKFEGKTMKDMQVESWEKQLNSLLTEGITVTSSTGQQGMPDSVSINATDSDAQELLAIVRQAGLGVFGGGEQQSSDYGAPMSDTEPQGFGSEPEVSPTVVGDGDDMLALIKKMTGIEMDDGQEEVLHGTGADYEDEGDTSDDEEETTEGNAFTGALAKAKQDGVQPGEKMKVGGKEYPVKEDDVEEGNKFTGNLAKARAEGKKEADLDGDGDMEKVHEGEHTCNECGLMEAECECDHEEEKVDEAFANDAGGDAMEDTELAKLKALLSMGNDLHKMKRDQTVLNPTQVSVQEALSDWKKLSGIK